jgi:chromatin remodeling complex protein RSC6
MTETITAYQSIGKGKTRKTPITNNTIRKAINNQTLSHQAVSKHLNACYMKYVKGPGGKSKATKPVEKKEEDGFSEQLVAQQVVNQQDQDQITNNPEENSAAPDSEPDQKPDFPKEIN